jgi:hypothetical protein
MKKLIIIVCMLASMKVAAGECNLFCSDQPGWKIATQLSLAPAYFMLHTLLHESSHASVGVVLGGTLDVFKPYPHKGLDGNFVFGQIHFSQISNFGHSISLLAPVAIDLSMIIGSDILLNTTIAKDSKLAPYILVGGMIVPTIDMLLWANGNSKYNDISIVCRKLGISRPAMTITLDVLAAISIYRIIDNAIDVFSYPTDTDKAPSAHRLDISPAGMMYSYFW